MPEICRFCGIIVVMYHNDHPPPHFHAKYAEYKAKIAILDGAVIEGRMPTRALSLLEEWRSAHIEELMNCWAHVMAREAPGKIEPLE